MATTPYSTSQIAKKAGIHPNTVRYYEELHYLPPVRRKTNGYRVFEESHLLQLMLIKTSLRSEILQSDLRKQAVEIILLTAAGNKEAALQKAHAYSLHLEDEKTKAEEAAQLVQNLLEQKQSLDDSLLLKRADAAKLLGVSIDVLRNWERNALLKVPRKVNGYRLYTDTEIRQLKIIRTLRHAGYSLMSILRMMHQLHQCGAENLQAALDTPGPEEDIVTVTDRLVTSLKNAMHDAQQIIAHIEKL